MKKRKALLFLFSLILLAGLGCNGYEDGPAISLRSKQSRMTFTRSITFYSVNGVDSLAPLVQLFKDSLEGFSGEFTFGFEPDAVDNFITWGDGSTTKYGIWSGGDALEDISLNMPHQPFDICCWEILRLSNKQLWLRSLYSSAIRELRFEE
jgi:hypothetical protein